MSLSHTPTRRVEPSLRVSLFTRSFDMLELHAQKRAFRDPGKEDATSVAVELRQLVDDNDSDDIPFPLHFRFLRWGSEPFIADHVTKPYVPGNRLHKLQQLQVPLYDHAGRFVETRDLPCAQASWWFDYENFESTDAGNKNMKALHRDGELEIYPDHGSSPRQRYIDDFIKKIDGPGIEADNPFCTSKYLLSIPKSDSHGSFNYMMEISGKNTPVLTMDVKPPDDSYALKFTLTLPVEDKHSHGTLGIRTRGFAHPVENFPHLRAMLFALWLVYSGDESTYFERWKTTQN